MGSDLIVYTEVVENPSNVDNYYHINNVCFRSRDVIECFRNMPIGYIYGYAQYYSREELNDAIQELHKECQESNYDADLYGTMAALIYVSRNYSFPLNISYA